MNASTHTHTLTCTNAPAWLLPPQRVETGPEHQRCWRGLAEGEKESRIEEEQERLRERNGETDGEMPGDTEPQHIPNRLAADLQIQRPHLV